MGNAKESILAKLGDGVMESFDPELRRAFDVADNKVDPALKDPEKLRFQAGKLKVSGDGVFYTLQGEGQTMGEPCVFIRTHICNLRCVWCDAFYTWNPNSEEFWTEAQDWTFAETKEKIESVWGDKSGKAQKRVIFTGGEPLLQQAGIEDTIKLLGDDWAVEVETNGTIMPSDYMIGRAQFNCSPKIGNSENIARARIKPEVLQKLATGNTRFKFVVMKPEELDEIDRDFIQPGYVKHEQVILMPQGVTTEEIQANMRNVAEYAKEKGFRMLGRLQVDVWGAKRRV